MIEPGDEKLARSDHHSRQGMRKPGDRAKKFNQKNAVKPKGPTQSPSTTTTATRTHGKRVRIVTTAHARRALDSGPSEDEDESYYHQGGGAGGAGPEGDYRLEDETEAELEERARELLHSTSDTTSPVTRGVDGIVLDETREAASSITIEELLASAYAKKPRKSRGMFPPLFFILSRTYVI